MGLFRSKKIQSLLTFIIVVVAILWIFQDNLLNFYIKNKSNQRIEFITNIDKENPYFEKIEGFVINEYSPEENILYTIDAREYFSYKESPIKLFIVEVKTYNENQEQGAILSSKEAQILETSEIIFKGDVNIESLSGVFHELQSESFAYNSKEGQISSNKKVLYQGVKAKINSEGMLMSIDNDEVLLKGAVVINKDPDILIESSNLFINYSKGDKLYQSEEKTTYVSSESKITAGSGVEINMAKNLTYLLGKVEIIENSGNKIFSSDLIVENNGDKEIYKTDKPSEYISKQSNIKANSMYYDVLSKKIDLTGKVLAVYE